MNLALGAVLLFILLLPPVTFYLAYTFGRYPKAGPRVSVVEGLMISAIFAVFVHAAAVFFIGGEIRFDVLAFFIGGDLSGFDQKMDNGEAGRLFRSFALYNFCLLLVMSGLGRLLRWLALRLNWHGRAEFFRLYNRWWYLFRGYRLDENIASGRPVEFDIVFVDALVDTNDGAMIYSGYLLDFVCKGEMLERIYLSEASKREFRTSVPSGSSHIRVNEPGDPKEIEGDTVSLNFSHIINLNLHFVVFPDPLEELEEISA